MFNCLNVLSQHSHGENAEKYGKPQSGYLMTQLYSKKVKVTMHISIVSVRLYIVWIAPINHLLLGGIMFRNGGCFTSKCGKKTATYRTYE